jgi:hypothetical protein
VESREEGRVIEDIYKRKRPTYRLAVNVVRSGLYQSERLEW